MDWFFEQRGERQGPVNESVLQSLYQDGIVRKSTLVWNPELPDWIELETVIHKIGILNGTGEDVPEDSHQCMECGQFLSRDHLIQYGPNWVCGNCKIFVFQRLKEGVAAPGELRFATFLQRLGAKIIDSIIVFIAVLFLSFILMPILMSLSFSSDSPAVSTFGIFLTTFGYMFITFGIPLMYTVYCLTKHGATPGKMAMGAKVVLSDGSPITRGRAFARFFAEILSYMILWIGYIMAAFDTETRTLHDIICDTRVVKTA